MNIHFREGKKQDRELILNANNEINRLSGLNDSTLEQNIDKDIFEDQIGKVIIAEDGRDVLGFLLYSLYLLGKLWQRNLCITGLCKRRISK